MDNFLEKFLYYLTVLLGLIIGIPIFLIVLVTLGTIILAFAEK
tara:strand:+ start:521 stop:649 length:129 start_codon:yes stop_codon:yes gene_type:complete